MRLQSVVENRLVCEYANGIRKEQSAEAKWRIHRNILSEQSATPIVYPSQRPRSPSDENFWSHEEVSPIFAGVIKAYGKRHKDFMAHGKIVAAFMEHPEGQMILNRPHDRSNLYWVGVMVAWFSKVFTDGRSEWGQFF
jgi:hypothetical protein